MSTYTGIMAYEAWLEDRGNASEELLEALKACLTRIESDIETDTLKTAEGNSARAVIAKIGPEPD